MKKLIIAVIAVACLTGCGSYEGRPGADGGAAEHLLYEEHVQVNGRDVTCVVYDDQYAEQGGLSCDFTSYDN